MSHGLPLVITAVGGLPAALAEYEGAILVPPRDAAALREAIRQLPQLRGKRFSDPHSWARTIESYNRLIERIRSKELEAGSVPRGAAR
jgi:glycosyltransferase involved in cell wall biosynthesis